MAKKFKIINTVNRNYGCDIRKYETSFRTYEEALDKFTEIIENSKVTDQWTERQVLIEDTNIFKFRDTVDVSNLYPEIITETYELIKIK